MSELLVVGAGQMAGAYVSVLKALSQPFKVVGRGEASAARFRDEHDVDVSTGGLEEYLSYSPAPASAIVAVPIEELADSTRLLAQAGTERVLVEKPGALNSNELRALIKSISPTQARVWVAYNRRFFQSTLTARDVIQQDGGVTSFSFEFSEWVDRVLASPTILKVKDAWVVANSSHVLDLAFHLGGVPTELSSWTRGSLPWHQSGDRFAGAGLTDSGALFSYRSDWSSPGRWRVEMNTRSRRLLLSPLETVQQMVHGSLVFESIEINTDLDQAFKPGIYFQTRAFTEGLYDDLCPISEQLQRMYLYERIAGYPANP